MFISGRKAICLLMNLGGLETRQEEYFQKAKEHGEKVFALTGEGIIPLVKSERMPVPVNVMTLSPAELQVWSSMINDQLIEMGMNIENVVILAAGLKHCGILPLGTIIANGFRIGA